MTRGYNPDAIEVWTESDGSIVKRWNDPVTMEKITVIQSPDGKITMKKEYSPELDAAEYERMLNERDDRD